METARVAPVEYKRTHFEVKAVDVEASTFEGYSAGIGNEDEGRDIIEPGAFKKTIRERVSAGAVKWLDQHNTYSAVAHLLGKVTQAKEIPFAQADSVVAKEPNLSHLLWSKFLASIKQSAQDALRDIDAGILDGLSIGYRPVKLEFEKDDNAASNMDPEIAWLIGRGTRRLKEVAWWETSTVIWGMNAAALIVPGSVKSLLARAEAAADHTSDIDPRDLLYAVRDLKQIVQESLMVPEVLRDPDITPVMHRVEELVESAYKLGLAPTDHVVMAEALLEEFKAQHEEAQESFSVWVESLTINEAVAAPVASPADAATPDSDAAPQAADESGEDGGRSLGLILDELSEGISEVRLLLDQDQPAHPEGGEGLPGDASDPPVIEGTPATEVAGDAEVPGDVDAGDADAGAGEPTAQAPDADGTADAEQDSDEHFPSEEALAEEAEYLRTLRLQMED